MINGKGQTVKGFAFQLKRLRSLYLGILGFGLVFAIAAGPYAFPTPAATDVPAMPSVQQADPKSLDDHLSAGRSAYHSGQFAAAIEQWQIAIRLAAQRGDLARQIMGWNGVASAQQHLSHWDQADAAVEQSLTLLQRADQTDPILWAQTLNTRAGLLLSHAGQIETALELWQQAEVYYQQADDTAGALGAQINQAQALQNLGFYRRAKQQLETVIQQLKTMPDSRLKVTALRSLGQALQLIGDPHQSYDTFAQSLAIAQTLETTAEISPIFLSIGKLAAQLESPQTALAYFQAAEEAALTPLDRLQARLDQLSVHIKLADDNYDAIAQITNQIQQQLTALPPSRTTVYGTVNLAHNLLQLPPHYQPLPTTQLNQLLAKGVKAANTLQDQRAEAYALYQMGQLYRHHQQAANALDLTQKSLTLAEAIQSDDIVSQSAWQLGQLFAQQHQSQLAIAAYTKAIKSLQALRGDLVAINQDVQFSYREQVEPVYREFVALLLAEGSQASLEKARTVLEALQIAELDNFFREACIDLTSSPVDQIDPKATVVYAMLLDQQLAVIYSKPGQPLRAYQTNVNHEILEDTLRSFLASLHPSADRREQLGYGQTLYDWLIRPAEAAGMLTPNQTLVFVLDGLLRNLPMAALHDGEQYLIEKYAIALSPGLQLLPANTFSNREAEAVVAGISQATRGFDALPGVKEEVMQISQLLSSLQLLNQQFTREALRQSLNNPKINVLHLASHGQFSSDFSQTFFLTWDGAININELSELVQRREVNRNRAIDLLTLSACETAAGDDRAMLGLAGLAVRSGARSTLATLWSVKDEVAKQLMIQVYQNLGQPHISKAEALRQAQLELLHSQDFADPFFWAAYVLIGNWL